MKSWYSADAIIAPPVPPNYDDVKSPVLTEDSNTNVQRSETALQFCARGQVIVYPAHPIDIIVVFIAAHCQRFEYRHIKLLPSNQLIHLLPTIRENKLGR